MGLGGLSNKVLLITGGTGSFGNAVLQAFLDSQVAEIRIFSRDEKKQHDMRLEYDSAKLKFYIGDVRDYQSTFSAFRGVDFVFHAAALKQVPSCEFYPEEAVRTNILGTENVINAALAQNVRRLVVLSTDKAVSPINAMGISKAMMEKIMVAKSRNLGPNDTVLCGTRYGNVMASRGSVIPLFIDQIKRGQPLTITNPDMTRFMMPLSEAIDLVFFAFENGNQGDIFVQKTPSCTILDLAEALRDVFGVKNEIRIIGTRHGEKQHESLMTAEEKVRSSDLGRYFRIEPDTRDLNYNKYFVEGERSLSEAIDYNSGNAQILSREELKAMLLNLDVVKQALV